MLQEETLAKKLLTKWFWLYLFAFLAAPSWYLIRVIISNNLSVWDVWIFYAVIAFIMLISAYNDLWLTETLNYYITKFFVKKDYDKFKTSIYITLFIQVFTWIIIASILFFLSNFLAVNYFHSESAWVVLKIFAVYFIFINFYQVFSAIYTGLQLILIDRFMDFIRMWSICWLVWYFWIWWVWTLQNYSIAWVWWLVIALIFSVIFYWIKIRPYSKQGKIVIEKSFVKEYLSYSMAIFIWTNVAIIWQLDQQMVIFFLWPQSSWYFANYLSLINLVWIVAMPFLSFFMPLTNELISKNQNWKLKLFFDFLYKYLLVFSISIWFLFMALGQELATIFFWMKFEYSWILLQYSWLFVFLNIFMWINFSILWWMWKVRERVWILLKWAFINLVLNLILLNTIWLIWSIIATIISWWIMFYLSFKIINNYEKISFDIKYIMKSLIIISTISIIIALFKEYIFVYNDEARYQNLIYLIGMWIIYYLIIWIFNIKNFLLLKNEIKSLFSKS